MLVNMTGGKKVQNIINEIVEPVLLWTNPSPTSNFNAQTVNLDGDWDGFLVEVSYSKSAQKTGISYLKSSASSQRIASGDASSNYYAASRLVPYTSRNSIQFGAAYSSGAYAQPGGTLIIPARIWGVKYTL